MLPAITPEIFELSLEQEFLLRRCQQQIDEISTDDLRESLLMITHQMMIKDNMIQMLLKSGA
jgi:hypothetical protein